MINESAGDRNSERKLRKTGAQLLAREPLGVFEFAVVESNVRRGRSGCKAQHERRWKWPWLRAVILNVADMNVGLFVHLASDGILEALTRFREPGDRGIPALGPVGLPAEQTAILIRDEYDDGGIDTGKNFARAVRIDTDAGIAT